MRNAEELLGNLGLAVRHVRSGRATSRRTLADEMRLSPTTAGQYADQLIESGYLKESGLEHGVMGRPKRMLEPVPGAGWFAGVEFHAERVRAVAVDFSGRRIRGEMRALPSDAGASWVMREVKALVRSLEHAGQGPLLGVGFGAPGIVDPVSGVAVEYAFMDSWHAVPVVAELKKAFHVPVMLENNLRAIALAERWFGDAREVEDYVILGPRSGFGIAIVQGGKLVRGAHAAAGEIGYWFSPERSSGTRVHDRLSSPAVWRRLSQAGARVRVPGDLYEALKKLGEVRGAVWREIIADYAHVLSSLQLLLDTRVFFLHGPLTALEPGFCAEVAAAATLLAPSLGGRPLAMVASRLDDEAGALGSATMAMESWVPGEVVRGM